MSSLAKRLAVTLSVCAFALAAHTQSENPSGKQTAPPAHAVPTPSREASAAPVAFSGCVMASPTDKDTLLLNTDSVCANLAGKFATPNLAGHQIDLKGVLTPRAGKTPASIEVDSVDKIGKSCSQICSPLPPRARGLGGERPGREGGRPGATPGQTPPQ
jgi:hypothetical protein